MVEMHRLRAIDPPGCGCTECLTGEYIPYDHPSIDEVLEAILDGRIDPLKNNLSDGSLVIYRRNGRVASEVHPFTDRADVLVIPPGQHSYLTEGAIDVTALRDKSEGDQQRLIAALIDDESRAENQSSDTYLLYSSPTGEAGAVELSGCSDEPVILAYDE